MSREIRSFEFIGTDEKAAVERKEREDRRVKNLHWMRQDLAQRHFARDLAPRKPAVSIPVTAL